MNYAKLRKEDGFDEKKFFYCSQSYVNEKLEERVICERKTYIGTMLRNNLSA